MVEGEDQEWTDEWDGRGRELALLISEPVWSIIRSCQQKNPGAWVVMSCLYFVLFSTGFVASMGFLSDGWLWLYFPIPMPMLGSNGELRTSQQTLRPRDDPKF